MYDVNIYHYDHYDIRYYPKQHLLLADVGHRLSLTIVAGLLTGVVDK